MLNIYKLGDKLLLFCLNLVGLSVNFLNYYGKIKAGDYVIITAASNNVGYSAIQLVKAAGAIAIATTKTSKKKQKLLDAGADYVIATEEEDLVAKVMKITSEQSPCP